MFSKFANMLSRKDLDERGERENVRFYDCQTHLPNVVPVEIPREQPGFNLTTGTLQAGLTNIMATYSSIKPFVLARLIRNLIDYQTKERFIYTIIAIFDLYNEYLPELSDLSPSALTCSWKFFKYCRMQKGDEMEKEEDDAEWYDAIGAQEGVPQMQPQGFVKTDTTPDLDRLCTSLGLDPSEIKQDFRAMEIPVAILAGLAGLVALFAGDKIAHLFFDQKWLKNNLASTARLIKDGSVVWGAFGSVWEYLMNFIGGLFGYTYINSKDARQKDALDRILAIKGKFDTIMQAMTTKISDIVQSEAGIASLEIEIKKLDTLIAKMMSQKTDVAPYMTYLTSFNRHIETLKRIVLDIKSSSIGKAHPTIVSLTGKAGIGKSKAVAEIVTQLSILEGRPLSVYTRNSSGDKFFSSYAHQDIVLYDDFGQDKENKDHQELVGIYSPASYLVNMSDNGDKGRPFTSKYVILCSNEPYTTVSKTCSDLNAVNRRRDWMYCVTPSEALTDHFNQHGSFPPDESDLWKDDFSHLKFDEHVTRTDSPLYNENPLIRAGVTLSTIVKEMYEKKVGRIAAYEKLLRTTAGTKEFIEELHKLMHIEPEENNRLTKEQREARWDDILAGTRRLAEAMPAEMRTPEMVRNIEQAVREQHTEQMEAQSIVTSLKGVNQYLLLGPSGCGKSQLLKDMNLTTIHHQTDVFDENGNVRGGDETNFHFEDCSILDDTTKEALVICQRLSDHKSYKGICVYSANPDMLFKNLEKIGEEACEVFLRRVKMVTIHYNGKWWFQAKKTAKDIATNEKLVWDDIYHATYGRDKLNYMELKLFLTKNERTIRTWAYFDRETLQDFEKGPIIEIDFPNLDFETFSQMEDYSAIRTHATAASLYRALRYLRSYEQVFDCLPRKYASPAEMVSVMNQSQLRVPASTPSARLNFKDFKIYLVNHKTYCLVQVTTPTYTLPDLDYVVKAEEKRDEGRISHFKLMFDFVRLLFGGTLVIRELLGYNQSEKEEEDLESESKKAKKARKQLRKQVAQQQQDTEEEDSDSGEILPRSMRKTKNVKEDPSPTGGVEIKGQTSYDNESRSKTKKIKQRKATKKEILQPRSANKKTAKSDPSPGAAHENNRVQEYDNESRSFAMKYGADLVKGTKVLTQTDISPRFSIPDFDNCLEINQTSKYHVSHWEGILEGVTSGNVPIKTAIDNFERYLERNRLESSILKLTDVSFKGASKILADEAAKFLQTYKYINLEPESIADPQAASLIPLLEKNQVFIYDGNHLSQRALMVGGHVGISTNHGMNKQSLVKIPGEPKLYPITILREDVDKDYTIFKVHNSCKQFKDIKHFIRSYKDTELLDGIDCFLLTVHQTNNTILTRVQASRVKTETEVQYEKRKVRGYMYAGTVTGFHLPLASLTEKGFCGSPTVLCNTRYMRKIISIHAAGNDNQSFGVPIYKEMFTDFFQGECAGEVEEIKVLKHQEVTPIPPTQIGGVFTATHELQHHNSAPVQTNIYRSPLQTDMFGDNFEPAILATYDTRNIDKVEIDTVTIEKWAREQPKALDLELLDRCVDEWANYFAQITKRNDNKQYVLTKTEAINRTTYYGSSQPIPRDTSAGYPWKHRPHSKGKELFIQPRPFGDVVLQCIPKDQNGQDLHHAIDNLIESAKKGEKTAVVFSSSAKDEVIKKKKIYPCRTRGFAGAPIDYSIAHRMYFHTAICNLIETRSQHPIKVGIEANGAEWDELYKYLASNSTVGFDADFKDWDASIPLEVMKRLYRIYNAIYEANALDQDSVHQDNQIRKWLHSALWGPLLTYGQHVVQAPGGQVSGQPATTIDNCLVGLIIMLYVWMKSAPEEMQNFEAFQQHVRPVNYGDDQAVSVKPEALKFFNLTNFCALVGEHFGMEATPASKEDESRGYKPITEIEFLKRNFIKIGRQYYGKIQPSVFDKMLNWTHTHKRHHYFREPTKIHYDLPTIEASIDSLLFELCVYEPDVWKRVTDHIVTKLDELGSNKHIPTQADTLEKRGIPHKMFLSSYKQN